MEKVKGSSSFGAHLVQFAQFIIEEIEPHIPNNPCNLMNKTEPKDQILQKTGQCSFNTPQYALSKNL